MNQIVRLTLEHAESGEAAMLKGARTTERKEVARRQRVQHGRERHRLERVRIDIETRLFLGQAACDRRLEEKFAARIVIDVEPQIGGKAEAPGEKLIVLAGFERA